MKGIASAKLMIGTIVDQVRVFMDLKQFNFVSPLLFAVVQQVSILLEVLVLLLTSHRLGLIYISSRRVVWR
jgi:hypothetical protein